MHVRLVVIEPDMEPREFQVELPATIGRGSEAQIKLDHALVSRRHCELSLHEGRVVARDLGSRNGTFVGGKRIEVAALPSGELLTVGAYTFRVIYHDSGEPPASGSTMDETAWAVSTLAGDDTAEAAARPASDKSVPPSLADDDPRRIS